MTSISDHAFTDCSRLSGVVIPDGVTSIGDYAFDGCLSLTSITIPASVKSIGEGVFYSCTSLSSVTIPDGVTKINNNVFSRCSNLASITIPDSVTSIGGCAFSECSSLTDIYYTGTEEDWGKITIGYSNAPLSNATIHFVQNTQEEYHINSITIMDMSGNSLEEIPTGTFLATVSFTNVSASEDAMIVLAQYTESDVFKGLMYVKTKSVPSGSTIELSIPVDNSAGDVTKLKAFCWESIGSLVPMGNSVSFPAK